MLPVHENDIGECFGEESQDQHCRDQPPGPGDAEKDRRILSVPEKERDQFHKKELNRRKNDGIVLFAEAVGKHVVEGHQDTVQGHKKDAGNVVPAP